MNDFPKNIELNSMNSLLKSRTEELSRNSGNGATDKTKLTDTERNKFAQVSRGFEAMFVNMMLKEMKAGLNSEDTPEFSGPLQEYTDMMLSDHISAQGTGIGIAEKVYQFLTGENLPSPKVIQAAKPFIADYNQNINQNPNRIEDAKPQVAPIIEKVRPVSDIKGNFLDKVKNRIEVYDNIIVKASEKFGVPQELIKAVITAESAGHNHAKSKVGAKGLMQLMDGTARELGVSDSFDPAQNIFGGTRYLRKMLDKFDQNRELALAAYNAGPGNVEKYGGIPPFRETESYVKKVSKYLNQFLMENQGNKL